MIFQIRVQKKTGLQAELQEDGTGFLYPAIKGIRNIEKLTGGIYGKIMLAELGLMAAEGKTSKEEVTRLAKDGFEAFGKVHDSFVNIYESNAGERDMLARVASAFYDTAIGNGLVYLEGSESCLQSMISGKMDCDIASDLVIQLGGEVGVRLNGVNIPAQEEGKPGHFACVQINPISAQKRFLDAFLLVAHKEYEGTDARKLKDAVLKACLHQKNDFDVMYPDYEIIKDEEELNPGKNMLDIELHMKDMKK